MKLTTSWLLPAFIATASAASDASVFILEKHELTKGFPPTLTPEQARLVIAQRVGASKYHSLGESSESTLSHIRHFGGAQKTLFGEESELHEARDVVVMIDGASPEDVEILSKAIPQQPDFYISPVPSTKSNSKLVEDISKQVGQNKKCALGAATFRECWTKDHQYIHHYDISKGSDAAGKLIKAIDFAQSSIATEYLNLVLIIVPQSSTSKSTYGTYEMPTHASLGKRQFEEPISYSSDPVPEKTERISVLKSNSSKPLARVPPFCYASLDSCAEQTNNCSGHGKCYKKRGEPSGKGACFACGCSSTNQTFTHGPDNRTGQRLIYWGGAACQKEDVSGQFWLLAIFTVVLVGLVSWSIGLMYSVGEEKLPGVIGAGVSNNRAK